MQKLTKEQSAAITMAMLQHPQHAKEIAALADNPSALQEILDEFGPLDDDEEPAIVSKSIGMMRLKQILGGRTKAQQVAPNELSVLPDERLAFSMKPDDIECDPTCMTVTATISTQKMDRSREIVVTDGIDTAEHQLNPVVLLCHRQEMPVGRSRDPITNQYTVTKLPDRLTAKTYFHTKSLYGEQAYRLVENGVFAACSIGFLPKPNGMTEIVGPDGNRACRIDACTLVEYSHLPIGDNPECVIEPIQKGLGGRALDPRLLEVLQSMQPKRKPLVRGGFTPLRTKAYDEMNPDDLTLMPEPTDPVPEPMEEMDERIPAGAKFLTKVHQMIVDLAAEIQVDAGIQESERVKAMIANAIPKLGEWIAEIESDYAEEFPQLPPLASDDAAMMDEVSLDDGGEEIELDDSVEMDDMPVDDGSEDVVEEDDEELVQKHRVKYRVKMLQAIARDHIKRQAELPPAQRQAVARAATAFDWLSTPKSGLDTRNRIKCKGFAKLLAKALESKVDTRSEEERRIDELAKKFK